MAAPVLVADVLFHRSSMSVLWKLMIVQRYIVIFEKARVRAAKDQGSRDDWPYRTE